METRTRIAAAADRRSRARSPTAERRVFAKIGWRLMPLLILSYILNYLDRTNVSFAALTMSDAHRADAIRSSASVRASSFSATASSSCRATWCSIASARASGSRAS